MRIGIIGGGQLARMLALAAAPLGVRVAVLDPAEHPCAADLVPCTRADYDDLDALHRFAQRCDAVTFDFENVSAAALAQLAADTPVRPNPRALALTQDRASEKALFRELCMPVARYALIDDDASCAAAADAVEFPAILKTRRMGYDGKGQVSVANAGQLAPAFAQLSRVPAILETRLSFQRELSMLAVRAIDGELRCYPLVQNCHQHGILSLSLAPAKVSAELTAQAQAQARAVAAALDYVGVFTIEFFDMGGQLYANEIAPRVHNSGHWTIEGAITSQFENHIRAICGMPLGATDARGASCMFNWVGALPQRDRALKIAGLHWHDYGKLARPARKVGHATLVAADHAQLLATLADSGAHLDDQEHWRAALELLRA